MAIKLDESTTSVVVYCTECGHWRAFAWTMGEAHQAAVRHEQLVHPDAQQAAKAADKWRSRNVRHAAESARVDKPLHDLPHGNLRPRVREARS